MKSSGFVFIIAVFLAVGTIFPDAWLIKYAWNTLLVPGFGVQPIVHLATALSLGVFANYYLFYLAVRPREDGKNPTDQPNYYGHSIARWVVRFLMTLISVWVLSFFI